MTDEIKWLLKPWEHQKKTVSIATDPSREGYALFWEMGVGKSFTAVSIIRVLFKRKGRVCRTLVLCPPVVIHNWQREIKNASHCGGDTICVTGTKSQKEKALNKLFQDKTPLGKIVITNYETLQNEGIMKQFKQWSPEILICDESHKLKNPTAKRTKRTIALGDKADYKLLLTGTPITNSPMDIYSQFRILDGGKEFGSNFMVFRNRYFWDKNASFSHSAKYFPNWVPNQLMYGEMNEKIHRHASILAMKECRELPELIKKQYFVDLSPAQRRVYNEMKKDFVSYVEDDKACVATLAMVKALRLMQITSGFCTVEDEEGNNRENIPFKEIPRAVVLREILAEITTHPKCIIWAVFKDNYRTAREVCESLGLGFVEVHGAVPTAKKQEAIDAFNNDDSIKCFIGNSASAGLGCNLSSARYAIFYSRNFSLDQDMQAEKRNHRPGCESHENLVRIDLIAKDTIDETIHGRLADKLKTSNEILIKEIAGALADKSRSKD